MKCPGIVHTHPEPALLQWRWMVFKLPQLFPPGLLCILMCFSSRRNTSTSRTCYHVVNNLLMIQIIPHTSFSPGLCLCVVTEKCPRQLDSHVLVKVKSMNIRWAWIICRTLVSVFNSELSGERSVYQQVDAYADQLGEEAHLANFYIPGPQFVFVNWLFSPRAYFAHLNFAHAACL